MTNPTPRLAPRLLAAQVFARDGLRCVRCGSGEDLQADHVIPWSQGGATTLENLQTLCGRCNGRKGPHGRRRSQLLPELARRLAALAAARDRTRQQLWSRVDAAIDAGLSKAAIARAVGLSRQALTVRQKSRAGEPEPDDQT